MNKKLLILLVAACAIFATGIFAACSPSETLGGKYTTDYHRVFTDECDDFMTIDGKLDEEVWTNKKYVTNAFPVPGLVNDVSLKYTVHATEKGLYIGSTVNDSVAFVRSVSPTRTGKSTLRPTARRSTIRRTSSRFRSITPAFGRRRRRKFRPRFRWTAK